MPRTAKSPKPTPAELDLLRLLWTLGPSTVKQVQAARLRERPAAACATVLRLLQSPPAVMGDELEAATVPLQALDANMEALGRQQDVNGQDRPEDPQHHRPSRGKRPCLAGQQQSMKKTAGQWTGRFAHAPAINATTSWRRAQAD